ncbi:MAG TPA: tRNA 2-selenouridine(34) synthase MnmH [Gammaproteobacteria bacterium]|nr:tRNA 2-selenouridine(34) synthase MnmH [Gammaproteobacteria bacterium]HIK68705.1 tRNA 2-selenouridine(34) synthase MnmH [Pseudomonadales bacterium]
MIETANQFSMLLSQAVPLIDVRAPIEYAKGSFPSAVNLPLLNDPERHEIGLIYKSKGQQAALERGFELVSGAVRQSRVNAWLEFIDQHEQAALYCFRGGLRSEIACSWLQQAGKPIPRVDGGYKALRQHLLNELEFKDVDLVVIAGQTGTGKTVLLHHLDNGIDLEHAAMHRGSAFGSRLTPQPAQIDFENAIAVALLQARLNQTGTVYMEDEGRLIGRVHLPAPVQAKLQAAPLLLLEASLEDRVEHIFQEYILDQWQEYQSQFESTAEEHFASYLLTAIDAIKKRLGSELHSRLRKEMKQAVAQQLKGEFSDHRGWIEALLRHYYDPMYNYQIEKKAHRIVQRGDKQALLQWVQQTSI